VPSANGISWVNCSRALVVFSTEFALNVRPELFQDIRRHDRAMLSENPGAISGPSGRAGRILRPARYIHV